MRVLLDENFPLELVKDFIGHECAHVVAIGWKGTQNEELLAKAEEAGFDVLLTFDAGIPRDHDITKRLIAVYVVQPEGQGPSAGILTTSWRHYAKRVGETGASTRWCRVCR